MPILLPKLTTILLEVIWLIVNDRDGIATHRELLSWISSQNAHFATQINDNFAGILRVSVGKTIYSSVFRSPSN